MNTSYTKKRHIQEVNDRLEKRFLMEQNWKTINAELRAVKSIETIESARTLLKSTQLMKEFDLLFHTAAQAKNAHEIDVLIAQVGHAFNNDMESVKNLLNAYAKERGFNNFNEVRTAATEGRVKPKSIGVEQPYKIGETGLNFKRLATNNNNWVQILDVSGNMSGWKFHVFCDNFNDAVFLADRLTPVLKKWGAGFKLGGELQFGRFLGSKNNVQYAKGATIYIPPKIIANGQQKNFLSEIQNAIGEYKGSGSISGDMMITKNIGYRYELGQPIDPTKGVDMGTYSSLYKGNAEGSQYNIPGNKDIFTGK
jgi:hypothetical protein